MRSFTGVIAVLLLLAFPACAINLVVVDDGNPPFMYAQNGEAKGIYPDLIRKVAIEMGEELTVSAVPWKRALSLGRSGAAAIAGIYRTSEREQWLLFSDPLYSEKLNIYSLRDSDFSYRSLADLSGRTVGVIRGWSYGDEFDAARRQKQFFINESANDETNFRKLLDRRIDCLIAIEDSALDVFRHFPQTESRSKVSGVPVAVNKTYLGLSRNPEAREFLGRFNRALKLVVDSGYAVNRRE